MTQVIAIIAGVSTFCSCLALIIAMFVKIVFSLLKKQDKLKRTNTILIAFLIVLGVSLITFIVAMVMGPKADPVGWCTHEYHVAEQRDATCTESGYIKRCVICVTMK